MSKKAAKPKPSETDIREMQAAWEQIQAMPFGEDRDMFVEEFRAAQGDFLKHYTHPAEVDPPMVGDGPLDWVAEKGLKALDYGAAVMRSPINIGMAYFGPEGSPEYAREVAEQTFLPNRPPAPGLAEVAYKAGIPTGPMASEVVPGAFSESGQGWRLQRGGPLDVSARGAVATAADMALSPGSVREVIRRAAAKRSTGMTAQELMRLKRAAKLPLTRAERAKAAGAVALDPGYEAFRRGGKKTYSSAFERADELTAEKGIIDVSDVAAERNVWGTSGSIKRGLDKTEMQLGRNVQELEATAENILRSPNTGRPMRYRTRDQVLEPVRQEMAAYGTSMGRTVPARKAMKALEDQFTETYGHPGQVLPPAKNEFGVADLSGMKSSQQDFGHYSDDAFKMGRGPTGPDRLALAKAREVAHQAQARTAREGVEALADEAGAGVYDVATRKPMDPGLGGQIFSTNEKLASIKEAKDAIAAAAARGWRDTLTRSGLPALAAGTVGSVPAYLLAKDDPYAIAMAGLGMAALTTKTARTAGGLVARKGAPVFAPAVRNYLNTKYGEPMRAGSPWDLED